MCYLVRMSVEPDNELEREPGLDEVSEVVVRAFEALPDDFKARWALFGSIGPEEMAERIRADFRDRPTERREILTAYLGRRLGYSRYLYSTTKIRELPLWDVQHAEEFAKLGEADRDILWMIAHTTQSVRHTLHPKAALATLALWRHGSEAEHERASALFVELGLPTKMHFIYELVRVLSRRKTEAEVLADRSLVALGELHLDAGMPHVPALLGGFRFVRRHAPWYTGSPRPKLEKACAKAALNPFENREWLLLMARAAIAGELRSSWLEPVFEAAIRLTVDDPHLNQQFRAYDARKLFDAPRERVQELYRSRLAEVRRARYRPLVELIDEVDRTAEGNPFRAMRLLELTLEAGARQPLGELLESLAALDQTTERLLVLYVECMHLSKGAVRFVRRHHHEVDWSRHARLGPEDVERFLIVGDYEATFGARDADLLGVSVVHLDKDAAARVRYFQTSRTNPNSMAKALSNFDLPIALPITRIAESKFVDRLTADFSQFFEKHAATRDMSEQVLDDLHAVGCTVDRWEDIGQLPIPRIEEALQLGRRRDVAVGAVAGGIAGALAARTSGLSSVMDVPFLMGLIADTCARHCWYYGFDPREHPELGTLILAVALGGVAGANHSEEEVRDALKGYLVRRSILLAAIGQGAVAQIVRPTIGMLWNQMGGMQSRPPLLVGAMERIVRRDQRPRFTRRMVKYVAPFLDGALGTAFNTSLVYDIGDAAQAVLADRFLDRKYPAWESRF